jgi:hypothetical protein
VQASEFEAGRAQRTLDEVLAEHRTL